MRYKRGKTYRKAEKYGIDKSHCFLDYHDLISCSDVDAIDISTPNNVHMDIAIQAARMRKPFALEKPITLNYHEAELLYDETLKSGVKNMICFSYRYKSAARYARDLIKSGALGRIYHVNMQYYQAWGLPDRDAPLVWRFNRDISGSGALGDLGCHAFDLVRFVTGDEYEKVFAHNGTFVTDRRLTDGTGCGPVDVDDFSNVLCETQNNISVSFQISRFAYGRGNYQRMEIYGDYGAIVYSLDRIPGKDEIELALKSDEGLFKTVEIPEKYNCDQMQSFADMILGKADGLSADINDGLKSQRLLDSILESAERGQWINL